MNEEGLMNTIEPVVPSAPSSRTQGWSLAGSYQKAANIRREEAMKAAMPSATSINVSNPEQSSNIMVGQQMDMGIKSSGAPVNFSPREQNRMTNMFGQALYGSYDRSLPIPPPADVSIPNTPDYGFSY
jgi:hypothetical protein